MRQCCASSDLILKASHPQEVFHLRFSLDGIFIVEEFLREQQRLLEADQITGSSCIHCCIHHAFQMFFMHKKISGDRLVTAMVYPPLLDAAWPQNGLETGLLEPAKHS